MRWQLNDRGFLPEKDPLVHLDDPVFQGIERLADELPRLVHAQTFREASLACGTDTIDWNAILPELEDAATERLFMLMSYCASAYVHSPGLPAVQRLPSPLAIPLVRLAKGVGRPPILSYASYCLHNWRRINNAGPVTLGNLALLQNFSLPHDGKEDEDWFILVHVNIEACAANALHAVREASQLLKQKDPAAQAPLLIALLEQTARSLQSMNRVLARMPEGCSPEVYFRKVRPYIFGFTDLVYEGCFDGAPQSYRGETGAQSSIVPTMLAALGIRHRSSLLTQHLEDMQNYMPEPHRQFIRSQQSLRELVQSLSAGQTASWHLVKEPYNDCIDELVAFRSRHFEYAVNYIEKKVANPIATGGTPYVPWLRQLIEETKEFYLA